VTPSRGILTPGNRNYNDDTYRLGGYGGGGGSLGFGAFPPSNLSNGYNIQTSNQTSHNSYANLNNISAISAATMSTSEWKKAAQALNGEGKTPEKRENRGGNENYLGGSPIPRVMTTYEELQTLRTELDKVSKKSTIQTKMINDLVAALEKYENEVEHLREKLNIESEKYPEHWELEKKALAVENQVRGISLLNHPIFPPFLLDTQISIRI
jgi:hypothetical protein